MNPNDSIQIYVHKEHADLIMRRSLAINLAKHRVKNDIGQDDEKNATCKKNCRNNGQVHLHGCIATKIVGVARGRFPLFLDIGFA